VNQKGERVLQRLIQHVGASGMKERSTQPVNSKNTLPGYRGKEEKVREYHMATETEGEHENTNVG